MQGVSPGRLAAGAFGAYHPAINFMFFVGAIGLGMFMRHPAFLVAGVLLSSLYYLLLRGRKGFGLLALMVPVFLLLSALNPLFNTMGETVLFTYAGGRPYTWEALLYGMTTGAMFVSMIIWFACYSIVMTSDKFTYLFGSVAPAVSMVLTMVLRLVPHYQRKVGQLATARECVGKAAGETPREKVEQGASVLSALVSWAFENAITMSDSMRSRGYGVAKRTSFSLYRFDLRDKLTLAGMLALLAAAVACLVAGAAQIDIIPTVVAPEPTPLFWAGLAAYAAFLLIPSFVTIRERVVWRISLSRI